MEATNLSKIKREKLLNTIKRIKEQITDEDTIHNLTLIENELTDKKYGLIWEEHEEDVDRKLKEYIPTFDEVDDKKIITNKDNSFNFLIQGDNLHSLYMLQKTHKGRIDIIYIDPPYNKEKDFTYSDTTVDSNDMFKHSKWLSFMNVRLKLAKELLSDEGIIAISIDDKEQAPLRMLCDDIFEADNMIGCLPRRTKSSGKTTVTISANHDYLLLYEKNKGCSPIIGIDHIDSGFKYEDEYVEERGKYKLNQTLDYDSLSYSTSMDYPIEIEGKTLYPGGNYEKYLERQNGNHRRADWTWRWSKDLYEFGLKNGFIVVKTGRDGNPRIYTKTYLNANIEKVGNEYKVVINDRKKPLSSIALVESEYSNDVAKKELKNIFGESIFDYPKPLSLIKILLTIYNNKNAIVLDFFAGTGTTGHAVLEQNALDGGKRKYILCTNNENNICENITYNRLKTVITGIKPDGKEYSKGISSNLKYYKTSYVPRINDEKNSMYDNLLFNIKNLIQLENGEEIDYKKIHMYLTEDNFDNFCDDKEKLTDCEKIYISSDILMTNEEKRILRDYNIDVYVIPEYYFEQEIKEAI